MLSKELIYLGNSSPLFKETVENQCLLQKTGDYVTSIDDLLKLNKSKKIIPDENLITIAKLNDDIKFFRHGEVPMIFIPAMEIKEQITSSKNKKDENRNITYNNNLIISVVQDDTAVVDDEFPGYAINNNSTLSYFGKINEKYAWHNNVWVIGFMENVKPYDYTAPESLQLTTQRIENRREFGGRIQIPNVSNLESWVMGKLEMKYFVNASNNGALIKEKQFPAIQRSKFDNSAWYELNDFIGYWNTANWGNITYERWLEFDGSGSSISLVYTNQPCSTCPVITITHTYQSSDVNCGLANVQFSDPYYGEFPISPIYWTIYPISWMSFQRKNEP